jgi:hypothetical protein
MNAKILLAVLGFSLLASSPLWTAPRAATADAEFIARLEQKYGDCEWKARNLTGGPKLALLLHHRSMGKVIERLKAGETVDAKDLQRVLADHPS